MQSFVCQPSAEKKNRASINHLPTLDLSHANLPTLGFLQISTFTTFLLVFFKVFHSIVNFNQPPNLQPNHPPGRENHMFHMATRSL